MKLWLHPRGLSLGQLLTPDLKTPVTLFPFFLIFPNATASLQALSWQPFPVTLEDAFRYSVSATRSPVTISSKPSSDVKSRRSDETYQSQLFPPFSCSDADSQTENSPEHCLVPSSGLPGATRHPPHFCEHGIAAKTKRYPVRSASSRAAQFFLRFLNKQTNKQPCYRWALQPSCLIELRLLVSSEGYCFAGTSVTFSLDLFLMKNGIILIMT